MAAKLYAHACCPCGAKAIIAAKLTGFPVEMPEFKAADLAGKLPLAKEPVLETAEGLIFEAHAIARHMIRGTRMYGATPFEASQVDQWMDFCSELDMYAAVLLAPIKKACTGVCPEATKKATGDVRKALLALNTHLLTRTFLVGERITMADVAVALSLLDLYRLVMEPGFRKQFRNTNRWFMTVVHQPLVREVLGEVVLCEKAEKPKEEACKKEAAPAKPKEEKPKKAPKKKEEEDDDEEDAPKEEKKSTNPLDLLPPSKFVMDTWKRTYSNEETLPVAVPWFWENYDAEGFSLYFCKYKHELDASQVFMVANLVGGFIQRLDALRKYGFGSLCIFGEAKPFEIEGVFLFRGKGIPKEMTNCDDCELYTWTPVDVTSEADRKRVDALLAWEGDFGGKVFNQGKIFK